MTAMSYNYKTIRQLIVEAFDDTGLTTFCHDYFHEVRDQFSDTMGKDVKAMHLVDYCDRHERMTFLFDCVKQENPDKFAKYEKLLTSAEIDTKTDLDKVKRQTNELAEVLHTARTLDETSRRSQTQEAVKNAHPLAGSPAEVRQWFLNDLTETQQVFVLTAALFSGLERGELMELFEAAKDILQPSERPSPAIPDSPAPHSQEASAAQVDISREAERTIRVTISMDQNYPPAAAVSPGTVTTPPPALFIDESSLFEVANLTIVEGVRNTEHGRTTVRVVEFRSEDQRKKVIELLASSFQGVLQRLDPLLLQLGVDPRVVIWNRAAETVGELMIEVDFIRYKQDVLLPWASSVFMEPKLTASLALAYVVTSERYIENVKFLLRHWTTGPDPDLNWTALAAYAQLAASPPLSDWSVEIVDMLENSLRRDRIDLLSLSILVAQELCRADHADLVITRLSEWISSDEAIALRIAAALIFLEVIELSQVAESFDLIDRVVDVLQVGLSDRKLTDSGAVREAMLAKLKAWSETSFDAPALQETMTTLFKRLYVRGTDRDRERLLFHVQRWARRDGRFSAFIDTLPKLS